MERNRALAALAFSSEPLFSDEFRIYEFKVTKCPCCQPHDWTKCPFVHPGENERRRDPRKHHYSWLPCEDFHGGSCERGDACNYAHGVLEYMLHPECYPTLIWRDSPYFLSRLLVAPHSGVQHTVSGAAVLELINGFGDSESELNALGVSPAGVLELPGFFPAANEDFIYGIRATCSELNALRVSPTAVSESTDGLEASESELDALRGRRPRLEGILSGCKKAVIWAVDKLSHGLGNPQDEDDSLAALEEGGRSQSAARANAFDAVKGAQFAAAIVQIYAIIAANLSQADKALLISALSGFALAYLASPPPARCSRSGTRPGVGDWRRGLELLSTAGVRYGVLATFCFILPDKVQFWVLAAACLLSFANGFLPA